MAHPRGKSQGMIFHGPEPQSLFSLHPSPVGMRMQNTRIPRFHVDPDPNLLLCFQVLLCEANSPGSSPGTAAFQVNPWKSMSWEKPGNGGRRNPEDLSLSSGCDSQVPQGPLGLPSLHHIRGISPKPLCLLDNMDLRLEVELSPHLPGVALKSSQTLGSSECPAGIRNKMGLMPFFHGAEHVEGVL